MKVYYQWLSPNKASSNRWHALLNPLTNVAPSQSLYKKVFDLENDRDKLLVRRNAPRTDWLSTDLGHLVSPVVSTWCPLTSHEFHETCHSFTSYFLKKDSQHCWHNNARVNSHHRWKQTWFRVCFHLWRELTSRMNVKEWQWAHCVLVSCELTVSAHRDLIVISLFTSLWDIEVELSVCRC